MNTVKLHQAIGNNPGKTIAELCVIVEMPSKAVKRAIDQLCKTGLVKPCGTVKNGCGVAYRFELV